MTKSKKPRNYKDIDDLEWSLKEISDAIARADIALKLATTVLSREKELQEQKGVSLPRERFWTYAYRRLRAFASLSMARNEGKRATQKYYCKTSPWRGGPPNVSQ